MTAPESDMGTVEKFKCMLCGYEYEETVEKDEDKERTCPKCRSNSIRHLKKRPSKGNNDAEAKS